MTDLAQAIVASACGIAVVLFALSLVIFAVKGNREKPGDS